MRCLKLHTQSPDPAECGSMGKDLIWLLPVKQREKRPAVCRCSWAKRRYAGLYWTNPEKSRGSEEQGLDELHLSLCNKRVWGLKSTLDIKLGVHTLVR